MTENYSQLNPPVRILMGPGPSNIHPRVIGAMASPILGYLDPDFLTILDETKELLRFVFQTENELTLPISGTGSAGMESCFSNLIEPGDEVIVCVNGFFSERMCDMVERNRGKLIRVEGEWGKIIEPEQVEEALKKNRVKLVAIVQGETSTGILQPLEDISKIVHDHEALLVVDAVTSLGGCDLRLDEWQVDVCYSCTQKCLGAPPGLSPVSFGPRALEVIKRRRTKVQNWYLDLTLIGKYWGKERIYHQTPPALMIYALYESLRIIKEEGLQNRFKRHSINQMALIEGLSAMGLELFAQEKYRLPSLTAVKVPEGVDDVRVRRTLLNEFNIEIGGGLGNLKGKIWRIGLMGYSSTSNNVLQFLAALEYTLSKETCKLKPGLGVSAALQAYEKTVK